MGYKGCVNYIRGECGGRLLALSFLKQQIPAGAVFRKYNVAARLGNAVLRRRLLLRLSAWDLSSGSSVSRPPRT